jgi:hypothetical protein
LREARAKGTQAKSKKVQFNLSGHDGKGKGKQVAFGE